MAASPVPWQRVTRADVPDAWRTQQDAAALLPDLLLAELKMRLGVPPESIIVFDVVLELPDFPVCRQWQQWYTSLNVATETDLVSVMITSQARWRDRPVGCAATLRSLMFEGKPTPFWNASWRRVA